MRPRFDVRFFIMFMVLFIVELLIALFLRDTFIRPFVGDVLVVMLVYAFVRMLFVVNKRHAVIGVFVFACLVEFGQRYQLAALLGLERNPLARVVIGSTFDVMDLAAYAIGALLLFLPWDRLFKPRSIVIR